MVPHARCKYTYVPQVCTFDVDIQRKLFVSQNAQLSVEVLQCFVDDAEQTIALVQQPAVTSHTRYTITNYDIML